MKQCRHHEWLRVTARHDSAYTFEISDRVDRALADLAVGPSFLLLIGRSRKTEVVRAFLKSRLAPQVHDTTEIGLYLDGHAIFSSRRPVAIMDMTVGTSHSSVVPLKARSCHRTKSVHVPSSSSVTHLLWSAVLAPFVSVVAVFMADFPSWHEGWSFVLSCLRSATTTTTTTTRSGLHDTRPHLVLIYDATEEGSHVSQASWLQRRLDAHSAQLQTTFSAVSLESSSPAKELSPVAHHRRLKEVLYRQIDDVFERRLRGRSFYSPRHVSALLSLAIEGLATGNGLPVDVIGLSRYHNPVDTRLDDRVAELLVGFRSVRALTYLAMPLLASSLLCDHYLPNMHLFDPGEVFAALYEQPCHRAFARTLAQHAEYQLGPSTLINLTREAFTKQFQEWQLEHSRTDLDYTSLMSIHVRRLRKLRHHWRRTFCDTTCLSCTVQVPSRSPLPCGHRLCSTCLANHGDDSSPDPCTYRFSDCVLCGNEFEPLSIAIRPREARMRILSIDGGGTRAVVPLALLRALEKGLGFSGYLYRFFDLMVGCSSGDIVKNGIGLNGWSAGQCQEQVPQLSKDIFVRRNAWLDGMMPRCQQYIRAYLSDSLYPSNTANRAFQRVFGVDRPLDDPTTPAARYDVDMACVVTTVANSDRVLLNNYNGVGRRPRASDYTALPCPNVPAWESVRATTAAPGYFQPHRIDSLNQTFQDGGTWHPNPIQTALEESRARQAALSDTTYHDYKPTYVLSLGSGLIHSKFTALTLADADTDTVQICQALLSRTFCRSLTFMERLLCSQTAWEKFCLANPTLLTEGRAFCFNVNLPPGVWSLDDVGRMSALSDLAASAAGVWSDMGIMVERMLAGMFYFRIVATPVEHAHIIEVHGRICSRWTTDQDGWPAWQEALMARRPLILVQGMVCRPLVLDASGHVPDLIEVALGDPMTEIDIGLSLDWGSPRPISGSPYRLGDLVQSRGYHTVFGLPDGASRKRALPVVESEVSRKRQRKAGSGNAHHCRAHLKRYRE